MIKKLKIEKKHMPHIIAAVVFIVFAIIFLSTLSGYLSIKEYWDKLEARTYKIRDRKSYQEIKKDLREKLKRLGSIVRIDFTQSDLFKRIFDMARISGIDARKNLAISKIKISRAKGNEQIGKLLVQVRVDSGFLQLGAFLSRLEQASGAIDRFEYILNIQAIDVGVIKKSGRQVRSRIYIAVYKRVG